MKKIYLILCFAMLGFLFNACEKFPADPEYPYNMKMTDASASYDAVYIDVQGVELIGKNWQAILMNPNAGIYNLLDFSNGKDTIIASFTTVFSTIRQIRLLLGPRNSVVIDSVSYPLIFPFENHEGLKLQVSQVLKAGVQNSFLLDFDANKSIVNNGNGKYTLKPVLREISPSSGRISGNISPVGETANITASSGETYASNVNANGEFTLMGVPPGSYSVTVTPASPFHPETRINIVVKSGVDTKMDTFYLL